MKKYFAVKGVEINSGVEYPIKEIVAAANMTEAAEAVAKLYSGLDENDFELTMSGYPMAETEHGEIYIEATKIVSKEQFDLWHQLNKELFSFANEKEYAHDEEASNSSKPKLSDVSSQVQDALMAEETLEDEVYSHTDSVN